MSFYLIGLGLELKSMSLEALELVKKADKVFLETYTVEFPYDIEKLQEITRVKISTLSRTLVEDEKFLSEAKNKDICLLVYGAPLMATTHVSLLLKCKELDIDYRILENASIFDAVAETGLQYYKFGKTASMPAWSEKYKPASFVEIITENNKIKAHTLILVDIGLHYSQALEQLEEACSKKVKLDKIIISSRLGTKESRIYYNSVEELHGKEIYAPFCIIIPSKLHFLEEEALKKFS